MVGNEVNHQPGYSTEDVLQHSAMFSTCLLPTGINGCRRMRQPASAGKLSTKRSSFDIPRSFFSIKASTDSLKESSNHGIKEATKAALAQAQPHKARSLAAMKSRKESRREVLTGPSTASLFEDAADSPTGEETADEGAYTQRTEMLKTTWLRWPGSNVASKPAPCSLHLASQPTC